MPDEQDLDLDSETQAGCTLLEPSHPEPDQQFVNPQICETQSGLPQPDVRTSSGRVVRKPVLFRDFV